MDFIRRAPNYRTAELPMLIVSMFSRTIGNTNVGCTTIIFEIRFFVAFCLQSNLILSNLRNISKRVIIQLI